MSDKYAERPIGDLVVTLTPSEGWPTGYAITDSGDRARPWVIVTPSGKILQLGIEDGETFVDFTFNDVEVARHVAWMHAGRPIP